MMSTGVRNASVAALGVTLAVAAVTAPAARAAAPRFEPGAGLRGAPAPLWNAAEDTQVEIGDPTVVTVSEPVPVPGAELPEETSGSGSPWPLISLGAVFALAAALVRGFVRARSHR